MTIGMTYRVCAIQNISSHGVDVNNVRKCKFYTWLVVLLVD